MSGALSASIYQSAAQGVAQDVCILDVLRAAERNNRRMGLSGCLAYGDGTYLQLLEGSREAVAEIMARIVADPRHRLHWRTTRALAARRLAPSLAMGIVDTVREGGRLDFDTVWRRRGLWSAALAPELEDALVAVARRKYPSASLPA